MKVQFVGCGVIGSILAAKLAAAGADVTVLARGGRLRELGEHGILIRHGITGERIAAPVKVIERPGAGGVFDLTVVPVRADQLEGIIPLLKSDAGAGLILVMVNNPEGISGTAERLGPGRAVFGFPGMGGGKEGLEVTYVLANPLLQKTTLGEPDGSITPRLRAVASLFRRAGFPVALERNMEAWQKTHIAWVVPLSLGIYQAGCDNYALAKRPDLVRLVIGAVRESFAALRRLGVPVTPGKFRTMEILPMPLLAAVMARMLGDRTIEIIAAMHCRNAPGEIRHLADGLLEVVREAGTPHPSLEQLLEGNPLYRQH